MKGGDICARSAGKRLLTLPMCAPPRADHKTHDPITINRENAAPHGNHGTTIRRHST